MDNRTIKILGYFFLQFFVFSLFAADFAYAGYQKIAPGGTVTLGEFVFDDDFVATTTDCWIGITDPLNVEVVASTTSMTANSDGWHYYDYTTAGNAPSGVWPSIMICGSEAAGDLVIADKSFVVDWSVVSTSTIKEVVDESLTVATSSLAAVINANTNAAVLSASSSLFATLPSTIWSFSGRTLTSFGTLVADTVTAVWAASTRTLTGATLDSGSLATLSDVQSASSSVVALVNANTDAQAAAVTAAIVSASSSLAVTTPTAVWNASTKSLTTFGTLVADVWTNSTRTLTGAGLDSGSLATQTYIDVATSTLTAEIAKGYTVTLSDFGETTVNTAYKAKLQVLNYETIPTDADSLPTVVVTDPVGTIQVPAGVMTKDSDGTYSYSYSIGGSAVGGVWETVVSVVISGETVRVNDYWSLSSSPADVQIIEITDRVIPFITANVRIDNMGTSASDFYYVYCVVNSEDNLCGGGDDVDSASDTAYINAGSFINLSLTLDNIPAAGTYWFKVKARALAETNWAASTEQFVAENPLVDGGGGGGGGGGGAPAAAIIPTIASGSCNEADFNADDKVNSVDFSILLAFWQQQPPFKNPCVDINKDNKVNSVDFSILLYQWKK